MKKEYVVSENLKETEVKSLAIKIFSIIFKNDIPTTFLKISPPTTINQNKNKNKNNNNNNNN